MRSGATADITGLLRAWSKGDESALERLVPLVDRELRRIARQYLAQQRPGHILQTTALVNEAYVRLIDATRVDWRDRTHFFAFSAQIIRRILVDHARKQRSAKRGGGTIPLSLDKALARTAPESRLDVVAVDEALTSLGKIDPRRARVVELRFFGGLTIEETAEALRISEDTVLRDWKTAKLWLLRELTRERPCDAGTLATD